jgi:hypothetical protein
MDYELKRALHLVNGGDPADFPPHETVVFDQCHLHDPELIRRRAIDLTYDGTCAKDAQLTPSGERYSNLSLNARSNIEDQAPLVFANFDQFERQVMALAQSGLSVVIFKCDGDAS